MMKDLKEKDDILRVTDGGLKVFQHYLGDKVVAGVKFKNPFYTDTIASCNLYYGKTCGRYFLVDFGDSGERGDCFWFVAKWENLDYHNDFEEILRVIDNELCLNIFKDDKKPVTQKSEKPKFVATVVPSNSNTILPFNIRVNEHFSPTEKAYWQQYGIDEATLERYNVKSVNFFSSQKKDGTPYEIQADGSPFFGYYFGGGEGVKIYRPGHFHRFVYAGKLPHPYVFGLGQLSQHGETLYFTGGEKDVLSLSSHGFHTISLNSETAKVPQGLLQSLSGRFERLVFLYDTDETGLKEASSRVEETRNLGYKNVAQVKLPLAGTKQEKDISDFFRLGHQASELQELTEQEFYDNVNRKTFRR